MAVISSRRLVSLKSLPDGIQRRQFRILTFSFKDPMPVIRIRVDRGSREPVDIEKTSPARSMGLSPQPDVLKSIG